MNDWKGIAAGLGTVACVVAMLIAGRLGATTEALTIYDLAGLRMGVAAILAAPLLLRAWPWRVRLRDHAIVAFFGGAPFILLLFGGMTFAPVGHAAVVMYGALPVFAALVAWAWVGERPALWQWLGIAAIVAGVGAVGWEALGVGAIPGQWRGHLLFVGAALFVAIWYGGMRAARLSVIHSLVALLVLNALVYLPIWLLFLPSGLATAPLADIALQTVVHGVFGAFLCIFGHAYAVKTLGPTRQAAVSAWVPAFALIAAIPTLGEIPGVLNIAGVIVVTAGILATVFLQGRDPARS
ncbi:MAG: EamA family transporter [Alphaproteobacteria bacterium]|nr:EamA family transporter [Alphaproteobacteria bacterium]